MLSTPFKRRVRLLLPVVASVTLAFSANFWSIRHPARLDLTSAQVYSISPETRHVLARIKQPVAITFFYDVRSRAMQDAKYLLEQYALASPWISVDSHDPVREPAIAERFAVRFAGSAVFVSGTRRVTTDTPGETEFTNALIRVTSEAVGRICFTDGHIESNPLSLQSHDHFEQGGATHSHSTGGRPLTLHERHGMGMARNALEVLGYKVEQRLLFKGPAVLADCSVVVVASPQAAFAEPEARQLEQYLAGGGPVLFLLEPGIRSGLEDLLARRGIAISTQRISDPERHYWTDPATPAVTDYPRHRMTRRLPLTFFPGAAELSPIPGGVPATVHIVPLVETSAQAVLAEDAASEPRQRTVMLLATAGKTRFIVSGDGDFASNSFFGALGNGQLLLNAISELAEHENLIDIAPRDYAVADLRLSNLQLRATFLLTTVAGPLLLLLVGLLVWRRRR